MATKTNNYRLTMPDSDECYDIAVFNDNARAIDAALGDLRDEAHTHDNKSAFAAVTVSRADLLS